MISESRSDLEAWAAALRTDPERTLSASSNRARYDGGPSRGPYSVYTTADLVKLFDPDDRRRVSLRSMGLAMGRAGHIKALHNNGRLGNLRATFWMLKGPAISSTEAAARYRAERADVPSFGGEKKGARVQ
jgi:hypothetical protein